MSSFKIPHASRTVNKSIRFPMEMVHQIEQLLIHADCSFSAFVVEATRAALEQVSEQNSLGEDFSRSPSVNHKDD
ncbi:MAG TPA: hypothetical protein H9662_11165 [Firmicutes bacterium]|nr:hypothetical protein [Bacillota bacterium]